MSTLQNRLVRMLGTPTPAETPSNASEGLRNLPIGHLVARGVHLFEHRHALGDLHGQIPLEHPDLFAEVLAHWGGASGQAFLDLETTGLAGGSGTYAFLAGVGQVEGAHFVVRQLFLESPAYEDAWLGALAELAGRRALVTYNGRVYDLPLLATRHVLRRLVFPWDDVPHLDLLHLARRLWRDDLSSCSLGTVESRVLGVERPGEDIPGALVPKIYADFLRSGDAGPLAGVFLHNRYDILSMAALQGRVGNVLSGGGSPRERLRIGRLFRDAGSLEEALRVWRELAACEAAEARGEALYSLGIEAKRGGRWGEAEEHFHLAAVCAPNPLEALVALAKVREHELRNPAGAFEAVERALAVLAERRAYLGRDEAARWRNDLSHRRERLRGKLQKKEVTRA